MKKIALLLAIFAIGLQSVLAQTKEITGTVTSADDGATIPGVSVSLKGTTLGTITDIDGKYLLKIPENGKTLVFSFVGMQTLEVAITGTTVDAAIEADVVGINEVVVTALGISKEKKSLGYSVTDLGGDAVSTVKQQNLVSSLSGKVAGVQIRQTNNFGGSANITIRGNSSIYGGNQPLFVVDGVPISGASYNSSDQRNGRTAYDYGNALSDINPDDIENMSILKGAAATAIYGSRGANGVVMITTKKGKVRKGIGVSVNSSVTVGKIDKNTFAEYQSEYGAGYGAYYGSTGYFEDYDVDGDGIDDLVVPTYEDASYGAKFNGQMVYHWDSFVPESDNYLKQYEYKAAEHTPIDFFETEVGFSNNVELKGGDEDGTFRISYTNFKTTGILPNSELIRNTFAVNGDQKINEKLRAGAAANFSFQQTTGRNSTGYSDNLMSQMRQWWQVNVDVKDQEKIYKQTKKNYSWNHQASYGGPVETPLYWDNPYWTRYENYQTDERNRLYGNAYFNFEATDWVSIMGRVSADTYNELREERRAVGSVAAEFGVLRTEVSSGYQRYEIAFREFNYDLMANFNKDLTNDLNLSGTIGLNVRNEVTSRYQASTLGGLAVPDIYALSNSYSTPSAPVEALLKKRVYGLYAQATLAYKNFLYLNLTDRVDKSSTLPTDNNTYNYYSAAANFIFSTFTKDELPWLDLGKVRVSYAEVGSDTDPLNVFDTYVKLDNFGEYTLFSYPSTKNNEELLPERSKELEIGLESKMFKNRLGFDVSFYNKTTEDMLIPVELSKATGYSYRWVNAATVENKGVEVGLYVTPVKTKKFSWDVNLNWARNRNEVTELYQGTDNIVINSYQGGITINATKGQPLGTLRGTGYQFDENGNKVVNSSGYYVAVADQVIGDQNPEWTGGITNTLRYKDLSLNFLIDIQKGGDVYSLDMHYGQGTGVLKHTAGLNELGNPMRDAVADGGGVLNEGVTTTGEVNTTRARADYYGGAFYWGNSSRNPAQMTVYDASFVKLREMALTYNLPSNLVSSFAQNISFSLVGRNLWIIHKNVPYADPESGLSSGLSQGYLSGSYPTVRSFGFNLKIDF
ncbi:SusC/RagA family TonB-linked outer membrane protein [Mangrovibacterium sp.]|uniref:SusC/RagA family TonB-linked outer membrane protein n=1 Tax=Mangrovibacterium sp. TaxID=1961364 RepID=UPI00356A6BDC